MEVLNTMREFLDKMAACMSDKSLVIIALTAIAFTALYTMGLRAENIVTAIVSGLCGIAVGHNLKSDKP